MSIVLSDVINIDDPTKFKLHLACWNQEVQPLEVFVRDRAEWNDWNRWRSAKDEFNRDYIFSLIDFYHEPGTWLFGGIFRVLSRKPENYAHSYEIALDPGTQDYIGRLKVKLKRPGRARVLKLENYYPSILVSEILKEPYSGDVFCGYENINHDFTRLEAVYKNQKSDWKAALENVKGVYLIVDKSNGKKYVGSAYGDFGLWSRWACYIGTGHGWNDELTKLVAQEGLEYARKNFRFSLLEYRSMKTNDSVIIQREGYWKEALLTRGSFGYNQN